MSCWMFCPPGCSPALGASWASIVRNAINMRRLSSKFQDEARGLRLRKPHLGGADGPPLGRSGIKEVILNVGAPADKADRLKLGKPALGNRQPSLGHEPAIKGHVVQRQQCRAQHLVGEKQMMQIGPAEMPARVAQATGLERPRISLVN